MEALEEFSGSNDHNLIMKGKRTKRQRPSSPVGTAVTSSLSSGSGGGGSGTSGGGGGGYFSVPSPISSGEISTNKEEDEDMANCLILLAQGFGPKQVEEEGKIEKLSSRKFTEMATTTTGKAGFFVYECKTCNRTFPSFQALGGHRASHKKPKIVAEEKIRSLPIAQPFDEEEGGEEEERQFIKISPPLSLQMASKSTNVNTSTKSKVHECSICGSEFSSGQALGGHMRRHRAPPNTRIGTNMAETNMNTNTTESQSRDESDGQRNILGLDLNLPAPPEDDHHRDSNFQFTAPNKHLVFSAPALVDCHY